MTLDPVQLGRIEATHSGFLYQHLFAVAQMLVASDGAEALLVESDEDVEILTQSIHWYAQIKFLTEPIRPHDVRPILRRFDMLREEHRNGRRPRQCAFAIVSRSERSPAVVDAMRETAWPSDVIIATPASGLSVLGVPAWASMLDAIQWVVDAATRIPFCRLDPDTLVWKLASYIQAVASGKIHGGSHEILFSSLPSLREQLNLFADAVPPPPRPYRHQEREPAITTDARVRLVVGVSGSGKSSWLSATSQHLTATVVFVRASSGVADVASWLVRHFAATLLRNNNEILSASFRPGALADESLRLFDHYAASQSIVFVIDNAHLLDSAALARSVRDTSFIHWLLLAQPGPAVAELTRRLAIAGEEFGGWDHLTIASVLREAGILSTAGLAERLRKVTGGLPLFVESTARVARDSYAGNLAQLLDHQSRGAHLADLPQETILARDVVDHLGTHARLIGAFVSSLRSDVPVAFVHRLAEEVLTIHPSEAAAAMRELSGWRILRTGIGEMTAVHDAFRPALDAARVALEPGLRERGLRLLLEAIRGLRTDGAWSIDLFLDSLKLLADLGDGRTLVDVVYGGVEWLDEYGASREVEMLLAETVRRPALPDEFQFLAADALGFLAIQRGDAGAATTWISVCERLAARQVIRSSDWESRLAVKRILHAGLTKNLRDAKKAYSDYKQWAALGTEGHRVVTYDYAVVVHAAGELQEAIETTTGLIDEYFALLGLEPMELFAKNVPQLISELRVKNNEDEFRHLADCLYLRGAALADGGYSSGLDPIWAMKLYVIVGAHSSAVRSGLAWANASLRAGDISGALQFFEGTLMPAIETERLMGWVVPASLDYAHALALAGRFSDARKRIQAVEIFAPALSASDRRTFDDMSTRIFDMEQRLGGSFATEPDGIRRVDRQRFDGFKPFRHPASRFLSEELAWFERVDGTAIGMLLMDKSDLDYGWVVYREGAGEFRAEELKLSYETPQTAAEDLMSALLGSLD